jgi:hypothetical protein
LSRIGVTLVIHILKQAFIKKSLDVVCAEKGGGNDEVISFEDNGGGFSMCVNMQQS